jgi:hypothetical protein
VKHLILVLLLSSGTLVYAQRDQRDFRDQRDQRPQSDSVPQFTSDAQQLGYEHGYRDGADRGRQDRDQGRRANVTQNDYQSSARYSYDRSYGNRNEYMSGYRDGFTAGYGDGYNYYERPGRYGQIYQQPPRSGSRGGPQNAPNGSQSLGSRFDQGYREGIAAGQDDQRRNTRSDYRSNGSYRNGDANYKDGFDRGYQDGYGRSRYQTDGGGYYPNRGTSGPADTRDGVGSQTRTITVPSTVQWTPTGIRVNQGDRLQFKSSGEIQLRPASFNDKASVAGSLTGRTAPNSPIPSALAGALIGRIDSGQPWGLGNQTSVVMPASGLLYLGINDDVLTDNSGQFTVTISW